MDEGTTFAQIKEKIISYEKVTYAWNKDRLMVDIGAAPLGSVISYSTDGGGSAPMEINAIKGKGKKRAKVQKPREKGSPFFRKAMAKASQTTKAKVRVAMARAMETLRKAPTKVPMLLENWMPTYVPIVAKLVIGRETAVRRKLTCKYVKWRRTILRILPLQL